MIQAIFRRRLAKKPTRFQEFVFVSDSAIKQAPDWNNRLFLTERNICLAEADIDETVEIEQIHIPRDIARQLKNLGFQVGKQVRLLNRSENGSVIVEGYDTSVGIGREIARRIVVSLVREKQK